MLAIVMISIGVLAIIVRGFGVVAPELGRKVIKWMIVRQDILAWLALIPLVIATLFVIGYCMQEEINWQANVALGLGLLMALAGLFHLLLKKVALKVLTGISEWKALNIRMISGLGVIMGALLIWLGLNI